MPKNTIAIHQPNYMPWIGYFMKMAASDIFVFHDNVQFTKSGPTRRVKISADHTSDHVQWLTVPLKKHSDFDLIKDLKISWENDWPAKHLAKIYAAYKKCTYFNLYYPEIAAWYLAASQFEYLKDVNIYFIKNIMNLLEINVRVFLSSDLPVEGRSSEYNLNLTKYLKGTTYLSGKGSDKYEDASIFYDNGIRLVQTNNLKIITDNKYEQVSSSKNMGLSIIDGLMNTGIDGLKKYLNEKNNFFIS